MSMNHIFTYICNHYNQVFLVMKRLLLLLIPFIGILPALAQMHDPVKFTVSQNKISDTEFEIVFKGQIESGWHVYSTDNAESGPTSATVPKHPRKYPHSDPHSMYCLPPKLPPRVQGVP